MTALVHVRWSGSQEGSQMEPQTTTEKVEGKPEVSSEQGESK
jgi:hypothetical protein